MTTLLFIVLACGACSLLAFWFGAGYGYHAAWMEVDKINDKH